MQRAEGRRRASKCLLANVFGQQQQHSCQRHFADAAAHTVFNCPAVQFRAARYECQIRTEVEADWKKETNRRYGKKQAEEAEEEEYPQQTTNRVVVVVEVVVVVSQTRTQKIVLDAAADADADVIQDWNTNLESTSRSPERAGNTRTQQQQQLTKEWKIEKLINKWMNKSSSSSNRNKQQQHQHRCNVSWWIVNLKSKSLFFLPLL